MPITAPAEGVAGNVTVKAAEVVSQKYPTPVTAGFGSAVILVVFHDTAPVGPYPAAVP